MSSSTMAVGETKPSERLRTHLERTYGIEVAAVDRLVRGVYRVHHGSGDWVARVFPADRAVAEVSGDAEVLRFLAAEDYPAERLAVADAVSSLHNRGVLVTEFVNGDPVDTTSQTCRTLGDLLGRLHRLRPVDGGPSRPAGALHHYANRPGGPAEELRAGAQWLDAVTDQIPSERRAAHGRLRESVVTAEDCSGLPEAIIHPDPVLGNAIAQGKQPVWIDWAGAGTGPRLASLVVLLWSAALGRSGWSPRRVDAVVDGYRRHVVPDDEELSRLGGAIRIRLVLFACWQYRHAVLDGEIPTGSEWWWPDNEMSDAVADHVRRAFKE